jgi:hypothetical protein
MTRKSNARSAGSTSLLAQQLHAGVHDRGHVEVADTNEQISVQPRLDVGPELVHVDRRWWSRHLDDDVDEAVDVLCADGDHHRLELAFRGSTTVRRRRNRGSPCVPSGRRKFPGWGSA